jgi:hypothetical protein
MEDFRKNFFIVRTPLQLLNATEARNRFHPKDENILLCIYRKKIDERLMQNIIDDQWSHIYWFHLTSLSRAFYPIMLYPFIRKIGEVTTIYIGLFGNVISHLVNSVIHKEVIIFDDGNEIIKIAHAIKKKKIKESRISHRVFGKKTDNSFVYHTKFFSIYDLSSYISPNKVIQNDYRAFKNKMCTFHETDDRVYFIGSHLVSNYLEKKIFQKWMKSIETYFSGRSIIYILHRYENAEILHEIGIETIRFDNIIEFQFMKDRIKPAMVVSLRSTALDTLKILYDTNVSIIKIPLCEFKQEKQKEMEELYHYYSDKGISVISLSPEDF